MKALPLIGINSLAAQRCFSALVLGLKLLPAYAHLSFREYLIEFEKKPMDEREILLREALQFVQLNPDEIEGTVSFCADANGIPYESTNIKNLSLEQLNDIIVTVCLEVSRIKETILSEDEKKKSVTFPSTFAQPSPNSRLSH